MANSIRAFLAVPVTAEIKDRISAIITKVRPKLTTARFVPISQLHLTLHFFEAISEHDVEVIRKVAGEAVCVASPFRVSLVGLGAFPNEYRPRVLWAGVREGSPELSSLAVTIGKGLSAAGLELEKRPFRPHLTLARFRAPPSGGLRHFLFDWHDEEFGGFIADRVILFQSVLTPAGAEHTPLSVMHFGTKA